MKSRRAEAPLTRNRKKQKEQKKRDAKRRKTLFLPRKVIGPNDIAVNLAEGKIKLEVENIKQEVGEAVAEDSESGSGEQLIDQNLERNSMEEMEHSVLVIKQELDHSNEISESEQLTEDLSVATESMAVSSEFLQEEIRLSRAEIAEKDARIKMLEENSKEDKAKITALEEKISQLETKIKKGLNPKPSSLTLSVTKANSQVEKPKQFANPKDNKVICIPQTKYPQTTPIPLMSIKFPRPPGKTPKNIDIDIDHQNNNNKVICLFPQVAQTIWTKYRFSYFRRQDFLGARLVHSNWKRGIDEIPQGPFQFYKDNGSVSVEINNYKDVNEKLVPLLQSRLSCQAYPKASRLCLKFEMEKCPNPWQPYDKKECKSVILALLKVNGPNIFSFEHSIGCYGDIAMFQNPLDWFGTLIDWLVLMPNLQQLIITHVPNPPINTVATLSLFSLMEQQVMLTFETLERISFISVPAPVIMAILGKSNRLINLHLELSHKSFSPCLRKVPGKSNLCSQLKHMSIKFDHSKCLDILLRLGLELDSLETLKLTWGKEYMFTPNCLCKILNKFKSLVDVELVGNLNFGPKVWKKLELSNLQKLELVLSYNDLVTFMQLVNKMPALTQLKISVSVGVVTVTNERQYKDIIETFVCDLWNILPKLEPVTIFTCRPDNPSRRFDGLTFNFTRSVHQRILLLKPRAVWQELQPAHCIWESEPRNYLST